MKFKSVIFTMILLLAFTVPAFADSTSDANATATVTQGGQNQQMGQDQKQKQSQTQTNSLSGNQSSVSLTQIGSPNLRGFGIPGTANYVNMPSEFLNDTQFANVQPVKFILSFGCTFNRIHLTNMKEDGWVKILQATNLYGNKAEANDTDTITFVTDATALPKGVKKIGAIVAKGNTGNTTTEQVLGEIGLQALEIKGAKYVLISGEGMQKMTKTSAWGISLGYTLAGINDGQSTFQTGTAGIGYSTGEAGRQASAFVHAVVLTDEAGFKALTAEKK